MGATMGTSFVPIASALAPFYSEGPSGHRTDSISSSVRPFPISPTRRTFSVGDFEPKIRLAVQNAGDNRQRGETGGRGLQPPPPPYPLTQTAAASLDDGCGKTQPTFKPLPLKLRVERKRARPGSSYLRRPGSTSVETSTTKGVWTWRGVALRETFPPLELVLFGLISLYAAATLFAILNDDFVGLALVRSKPTVLRRLEGLSAQAFSVPKLTSLQNISLTEIGNWATGIGALVAVALWHLSTRLLYLVLPWTFAVLCAFFGCAGVISGLYYLTTARETAFRPPSVRALRRTTALRRVVYLVSGAACAHFALSTLEPRPSIWWTWAAYALSPPATLFLLETLALCRSRRVPEAQPVGNLKYRLPRSRSPVEHGGGSEQRTAPLRLVQVEAGPNVPQEIVEQITRSGARWL